MLYREEKLCYQSSWFPELEKWGKFKITKFFTKKTKSHSPEIDLWMNSQEWGKV